MFCLLSTTAVAYNKIGNYKKLKSAWLLDKNRKELYKIFEQFYLKITAEVNLNVVNFEMLLST
jgi:hypothetical protein